MGTLELLNPKGLFLLGALVPLVALYVLRVRRTRIVVGSTWLYRAAARDLVARHPFRRLVPEVSLFLQILAIVLLSLSLARPSLRGDGLDGDALAVVIDASASMGTRVGAGPERRIDRAKAAAREAIAGVRPGSLTFVVVDAQTPRLVGAPEPSRDRTLRSLDAVEPRDVEGNLTAAMALAADRLRSLPGRKTLLVVTDGAVADGDLPATPGVDARVIHVGDEQENTAIVRLDVRAKRAPKAPSTEQVEVFGLVRHFGHHPRDVYVTLTVAGEAGPRASRRLLVAPGADVPVLLTFDSRPDDRGRPFYLQLSPYDALALDDVAFGLVPKGLRMPVTLATDRPYSWLERALDSDDDVALQKLSLADLGRVPIADDALVVVEGSCPTSLPGHDVVVVAPPPGACLGAVVGAAVDVPHLTSWESGDPRLRFLSLDGVRLAHATPLELGSGRGALVRSDRGPLIVDVSTPGRTATLLGFDVGDTDWPLRASFVLFVRNLVELSRTHRAYGAAGPVLTGGALRVAAPPDAETGTISLEGDPSYTRSVGAKTGFVVVSPVERAGLYRVTFSGPRPTSVLVPANLTSARESDVWRRPLRLAGAPMTVDAPPAPAHREGTALFALLAAALVLADVWVLTRAVGRRLPSAT